MGVIFIVHIDYSILDERFFKWRHLFHYRVDFETKVLQHWSNWLYLSGHTKGWWFGKCLFNKSFILWYFRLNCVGKVWQYIIQTNLCRCSWSVWSGYLLLFFSHFINNYVSMLQCVLFTLDFLCKVFVFDARKNTYVMFLSVNFLSWYMFDCFRLAVSCWAIQSCWAMTFSMMLSLSFCLLVQD